MRPISEAILVFFDAAKAEELHGKQCEGTPHFKVRTADEY
jgi:hypothetical protein